MEIRAAFFGYSAFQAPSAEAKPSLPHHGAPPARGGLHLGLPHLPHLPGRPPVRTPRGPMLVNRNTNTVDTGNYTIQGSKDTLTVTDKTTGESFKVWGDPHIQTSDGDSTGFMQKPATFQLPDGTKITVTPTKSDTPNIDNITITRGSGAVQMNGVHTGQLHTDIQRGQGRWLDARTPDGTMLTAENGHIKDLQLANGTEIDGHHIKNVNQFAVLPPKPDASNPLALPPGVLADPMAYGKYFSNPLKHPGKHRPNPFPPVLYPGWGASKPNHMGPFLSNLHPGWGVGMIHQMGQYLAVMFPKPVAGKPGMEPFHPTARHPQPFKVDTKTNTVDTGRYTLQASKGTLTVKDNTSGESFKVWNDPYIDTSGGGRTSFLDQPATFLLPDGTKITVTPTKQPQKEYPNAWSEDDTITIDTVTITRGNDAVQISGVSGRDREFSSGRMHTKPIETQVLREQGRYLDAATPNGTVLTAKNGPIKDIKNIVLENGTEIKGWNTIKNIENPTNNLHVTMQVWRESANVT